VGSLKDFKLQIAGPIKKLQILGPMLGLPGKVGFAL